MLVDTIITFGATMRVKTIILSVMLLCLAECAAASMPASKGHSGATDNACLNDKQASDIMVLIDATNRQHHAIQQETVRCAAPIGTRVMTEKEQRTDSARSYCKSIIAPRIPAAIRLNHHPINLLLAFPKEYHIFQLRRLRL